MSREHDTEPGDLNQPARCISRLQACLIGLALWLHTLPAAADADRNPLDYSLRQYAFLLGVALLGGAVSWYAKVQAGQVAAWSIMHLVGELVTSAFAGLLTFWIAESVGAPQLVTISLVGIAGHMGARAITNFEVWAAARWGLPGEREKDKGPQP